ncbi:MAG: hypothetical protein ABSF90_21905 [Syntrophobacteraceae bacterium]|jgi:hypothetical protein
MANGSSLIVATDPIYYQAPIVRHPVRDGLDHAISARISAGGRALIQAYTVEAAASGIADAFACVQRKGGVDYPKQRELYENCD